MHRTGFICSDHPSVLYNQLLEDRRSSSNVGFAEIGLQIFLPLSACHSLCFYDPFSYGVGGRRTAVVDITDPDDVRQLNELQFVNAYNNVYFDKRFNAAVDLIHAFDRCYTYRQTSLVVLTEQAVTLDDGRTGRLLTMHSNDVRIGLRLSGLKILPRGRAKAIDLGTRVGVRSSEMVAVHQKYSKLVADGRYRSGQFRQYLRDEMKQATDSCFYVHRETAGAAELTAAQRASLAAALMAPPRV